MMRYTDLRRRWTAYKEHLRFKYVPTIANWIAAGSTMKAKAKLAPLGRISILVDNTVLQHAVTHETAWISTGPKMWGSQEVNTGYSARVPVHTPDSDSREYRNVCYLAGIAQLCRSGHIGLYLSAELDDERDRQPFGRYRGYGYFDFSLFDGLNIPSVDGFSRSFTGASFIGAPSWTQQQRTRLEANKREALYAELVNKLGPRNSQDAWHIFTAEKHGMFCFLTMDFKLIRTVEAQANSEPLKSFKTLVLTPESFGKRFGLIPIAPHIFSYDKASFFVRPDLAMPNNKRRALSDYRRERP